MGKIADIIVKYSIKIKDWNKRRAISLFEIEQAENEIIELIKMCIPPKADDTKDWHCGFNHCIELISCCLKKIGV